jgi:bla regulator protein blaR1
VITEIFAHIWQSTLCGLAAALLVLALRRNRASVRYWIWFAASAKFLIPFALLAWLGTLVPHGPAPRPVPPRLVAAVEQFSQPLALSVPTGGPMPAPKASHNYLAAITLAVWASGFAVVAAFWTLRWRRVYSLRKQARHIQLTTEIFACPDDFRRTDSPPQADSLPHIGLRQSRAVRLHSGVEISVPVMSAPDLLEPGVFGILRPVLLLPEGIVDRLDQTQLDAILAHESYHIRRKDNLTAAIHMAVQAIFWFHPLTWWIGARLIDEREKACDEEVLGLGYKPDVYAESILAICKLYLESPLACLSGVTGSDLKKRIEAIMKNRMTLSLSFGKKLALSTAGIAAVAAPIAVGILLAQDGQVQQSPTFEVASVRPSPPPAPGARVFYGPPRGGPGTSDPGQITWSAASLLSILMVAYEVQAFQVNAPDWAPTTRYDVLAKVPAGTTKAQVGVMWRNLLRDRLGVAVHHVSKEFQVYELTLAKGSLKMKETDLPSTVEPFDFAASAPKFGQNGALEINGTGSVVTVMPTATGATARLAAKGLTMPELAARLGGWTSHPIVDRTGLSGRFDFLLEFTPDTSRFQLPPGAAAPPAVAPGDGANDPGSDVASAIEKQLGLKLTEAKAMLDVIVVDHAEKTPTEN